MISHAYANCAKVMQSIAESVTAYFCKPPLECTTMVLAMKDAAYL